MDDTQPNLSLLRAYTPDLLGFLTKFGQITAYYDGNGHYARILPDATGAFDYDPLTSQLNATYTSPYTAAQFNYFDTTAGAKSVSGFERCPGAATQAATDASNPFVSPPLSGGAPAAGCDPSALPPGP